MNAERPLETEVRIHELAHALSFAAGKHRDQRRRDKAASPYINHPIALLEVLTEAGINDTVTLMAAVLHDTVEDTETTVDELIEAFGSEVAHTVAEVTDDKKLPKAQRKRLQVEHGPHLSLRAKLVKLADKISNVSDIVHTPPDWPLKRRQEYFDWAAEVVHALGAVHPALQAKFRAVLALRPVD